MTEREITVPLVLGLAADDAPAETCEGYVRAALTAIVGELRAAYPHTKLLALCALASPGEHAAARTAQELGVPVLDCLAEPTDDDVVHFSDVLLAFGAPPEPGSRLATVVTRRDQGRLPGARPPGRILDPPDVGPYRRIVPRGGDAYAVEEHFPPRYHGDRVSRHDATFALARLDEFNTDVHGRGGEGGTLFSESLERLADLHANALQSHVTFWQRFLYWAGFVAASAQFILPKTTVAELIDAGTVAVAFAAYFIARPRAYQGRYQDYRALSEGLRVQSAWTRAGVTQSVAGSYLRMQQTELLWIRNALRTVALLQVRRTAVDPERDRDAVAAWVKGQRSYFRDASRREAGRERTFDRWSKVLAPLNLVLGVAIFAYVTLTGVNPRIPWLSAGENPYTLELLVGTFAGWAALSATALHSYARTRGFSENANRYERMYLMFDEASLWLDGKGGRPPAEVRELAAELGREALTEHAEWLLAQRDRPIGLVHVGA